MRGEGLRVLGLGKDVAVKGYKLSEHIPKSELYNLVSQIRRCSVSIPSNIAEGNERGGKDFVRFLRIARGSLKELEVQLFIAKEIYNVEDIDLNKDLVSLSKMLFNLIISVEEISK